MSSLDMYTKRGDIFTHDCLEMLMLTIIYGWIGGGVLHSYDILGARMLWTPKEARILKNFIDQPV